MKSLIGLLAALGASLALAQTTPVTISGNATATPGNVTIAIPSQVISIAVPVTPACGAAPASTTAQVACPAGTTGTWPQTTNYQSTAAPQCWSPVLNPLTPPGGYCPPVVTPPPATGCSKNSSSYVATANYAYAHYGNYINQNNNWGAKANTQTFWSNSADCWGVTTTHNSPSDQQVYSYPNNTRGWTQNQDAMQALGSNWTTKSGMGIQLGSLTKAKIHWALTKVNAPTARALGLMDIYFHATANPAPTEFPPKIDLMIDQWLSDQPFTCCNATTYYDYNAQKAKAQTITLGAEQYVLYIDSPDEAQYHQTGGHTIHLFRQPTSYPNNATAKAGPNWGLTDATTDLKAIIAFLSQATPMNDAGKQINDATGKFVGSLFPSTLYLTAINAGPEITALTTYTNTAFCVSVQGEADCP